MITGYDCISWVIRQSFEKCGDFECAKEYLSRTPIIAPGYITIAGIKENEGVVITRDRLNVAHIDELTENRWYLIQTN